MNYKHIQITLYPDYYDKLLNRVIHEPIKTDTLIKEGYPKTIAFLADSNGLIHESSVYDYIQKQDKMTYNVFPEKFNDYTRLWVRLNEKQQNVFDDYSLYDVMGNENTHEHTTGYIDFNDSNIIHMNAFVNKPSYKLFFINKDLFYAKEKANNIVWGFYPPKIILSKIFKEYAKKHNYNIDLKKTNKIDELYKSHNKDAAWEAHMEMKDVPVEKDYSDLKQFTTNNLMKNNPLNIDHAKNPTKALLAYHILSHFPKPLDMSKKLKGRMLPNSPENQAKMNQEHEQAFYNLKNTLENSFHSEDSPIQMLHDARSTIIDTRYDLNTKSPFHRIGDHYSNYLNNILSSSGKKNLMIKIDQKMNDFLKQYYDNQNDRESAVNDIKNNNLQKPELNAFVEKTLQGKSIDSILQGLGKQPVPKQTDLSSKIERRGPEYDFHKDSNHLDFLSKSGIQMTQPSGKISKKDLDFHHSQVATAFKDLVDILDLPDEMISFNNRLKLQVGIKGNKNAHAYYSPSQNLMYITHKDGLGTIAHEWYHFFDHVLHSVISGVKNNDMLSQRHDTMDIKEAKELIDAVSEINKELKNKYTTRLNTELATRRIKPSVKKYLKNREEMFARAFESYVNTKLEAKNRKNTYLSGNTEDKWWYPTKEESIQLSHGFDKLFKLFKKSDYLKKTIDYISNLQKSINLSKIKANYSDESKEIVDGDHHVSHIEDDYHSMVNDPKEYDDHPDWGGISIKVVNRHPTGTYMTKPYYNKLEDATRNVMKHPISGWSSLTTKALFNAAGIDHLCEDISARNVNGNQVVVSKFHPDMQDSFMRTGDARTRPSDIFKIGIMDFLTNNFDRHHGNIMISSAFSDDDHHDVLAIDHDRNFQYFLSDLENLSPTANLETYLKGRGGSLEDIQNVNSHMIDSGWDWWKENSDKIKNEFKKHIKSIKDQRVREHIQKNFEKRAKVLDKHADLYSKPEDVIVTNIAPKRRTKLSIEEIQNSINKRKDMYGKLQNLQTLRKLYTSKSATENINEIRNSMIGHMSPDQLINETIQSINNPKSLHSMLNHIFNTNDKKSMKILIDSQIRLPVFFKNRFKKETQ